MLIYPGYIDALCWHLFGFDGPDWFNNYWSALGSNILASSWKTMPFWTLILLAGRMAIPQDLYDAAAIDGASGFRGSRIWWCRCWRTCIWPARCWLRCG